MKIMVSACLLGENCKYKGGNNLNRKLLQVLSGHTVIPVCPEVLGGLPVPRIPAEIVNGCVMNREGVSVDKVFRRGAEKALEIAKLEQPDLIVLQSRNPSLRWFRLFRVRSPLLTESHMIYIPPGT